MNNYLNRGLVINAQGIQLSDFLSYNFKQQHKHDSVEKTSFCAKLFNSTTKKESFLLESPIEISYDDLEYASQIFDTDEAANSARSFLVNESSVNDVILVIEYSKAELTIEKETIKPSDELTDKIKEALKHHDPYYRLMYIFNIYGYFLPKKIILGHKMYRMTHLTKDKRLNETKIKINETKWTTLDDFSDSKLGDILSQWEKCIGLHNFDLSHFVSIDDKIIRKDKLKEWIKFCLESDLDSLQVISCKELYSLYKIFDSTLRHEVKSVLEIKEKVLMTGIVPIKDPPYLYSINFPVCFKSNDYQVLGKFIAHDGESINEVDGIPAKIGYFSKDTRKISIFGSDKELFKLNLNNDIILKFSENLPSNSVIFISFKCPPSNNEQNFITKIQNHKDNEFSINISYPSYEFPFDENNVKNINILEYSIQWLEEQ
ncbi:23258_t:CDS:2 [Racocetra persica]|uniref:23258_t:CDS:1 n=1 Tax=Racocetra persica TaxID=160502 RepID=A0ACA9QUS3_9GLOM|nr:23258_t:CDS:2 [Racocetra persica]